jgi:hypothetical protein
MRPIHGLIDGTSCVKDLAGRRFGSNVTHSGIDP